MGCYYQSHLASALDLASSLGKYHRIDPQPISRNTPFHISKYSTQTAHNKTHLVIMCRAQATPQAASPPHVPFQVSRHLEVQLPRDFSARTSAYARSQRAKVRKTFLLQPSRQSSCVKYRQLMVFNERGKAGPIKARGGGAIG